MTFCLAEDRVPEEVGLRFALLSLRRHCPDAPVVVYRHAPSQDFVRWLDAFPQVELVPERPTGASAWNCKPQALLPLLDKGADAAVWLDSDIILTRDPREILLRQVKESLVVVREQKSSLNQGTLVRTTGWGLRPGRVSPFTYNSCVLRVTSHHRHLLEGWRRMLDAPEYVAAQNGPLQKRPIHHMSDQDVLNALVGSAEFSGLPVEVLETGRDVIHAGGALAHSLGERLLGMFHSIPPFIHGQGAKPWIMFDPALNHTGWFWWYRKLLQEVSPYFALAREYRDEVGLDCSWLDRGTAFGRFNRAIGLGHFALTGLPLTAAATLIRVLRGNK